MTQKDFLHLTAGVKKEKIFIEFKKIFLYITLMINSIY
jgi:hypothetical protein